MAFDLPYNGQRIDVAAPAAADRRPQIHQPLPLLRCRVRIFLTGTHCFRFLIPFTE